MQYYVYIYTYVFQCMSFFSCFKNFLKFDECTIFFAFVFFLAFWWFYHFCICFDDLIPRLSSPSRFLALSSEKPLCAMEMYTCAHFSLIVFTFSF